MKFGWAVVTYWLSLNGVLIGLFLIGLARHWIRKWLK